MNWEILTALGQLAAVFVGIPSFIYLAVQIREQTKERRQSAVNVLTAQWGDLTCRSVTIARNSEQFFFGAYNLSPISMPVSKLRFSAFFNTFLQPSSKQCISPIARDILTASSWGKMERTLSDYDCLSGSSRSGGSRENIGTRKNLAASWVRSSHAAISPRLFQHSI